MHRWLMMIAVGLLLMSVALAEPVMPAASHQNWSVQPAAAAVVTFEDPAAPVAGSGARGWEGADGERSILAAGM